MKTKLYIYDYTERTWTELPVYNRVEYDERLDEQLDSGSIQTIQADDKPFADFSLYRLEQSDAETTKTMYFYGFDSTEKRGKAYYIHTIELVEMSRLLMGQIIEGRKVSQPINVDKSEKLTLYDVLQGLLWTFELLEDVQEYPGGQRFYVTENHETVKLLEDTISPEFHWECGTLLWECLCDIGKVINCIPRLVPVFDGDKLDKLSITFDKINKATAVYEM